MTRKNYIAIAAVFKAAYEKNAREHYVYPSDLAYDIQSGIADVLAADNPLFDRNRFHDACWSLPTPRVANLVINPDIPHEWWESGE